MAISLPRHHVVPLPIVPSLLSYLLFLTILLLSFARPHAQLQHLQPHQQLPSQISLSQPFNITKKHPSWLDRIKAIQINSPTCDALRDYPKLRTQLDPLYDLIDTLTGVIQYRTKNDEPDACSLRLDTAWVKSCLQRVQVMQLGEFSTTCLSLVKGDDAISKNNYNLSSSFKSDAIQTIRKARDAFFEATSHSSLNETLRSRFKWKEIYKLSRFNFVRDIYAQTCDAEYIFAYRVYNKWYVRHSVTNTPLHLQMKDWNRNYTHEYIARDLSALAMVQPSFDNASILMNASTLMVSWGGNVAPGTVWAKYEEDEDQAIATALRRNAEAINLAEDSITGSNIAILALPMLMSFVPLAFMADLDSCGTLLYGLLTDVFAAVPFLVKGIELVLSSSNRQTAVNTFYMGNATLGQMEIVTGECVGRAEFGNAGWAFIVVALIMMFMGILLEVIAARMMARQRGGKISTDGMNGPFGAALFARTAGGFLSGEFERAEGAYRKKIRGLRTEEERQTGWWSCVWGEGGLVRRRTHAVEAGCESAERETEEGYDVHNSNESSRRSSEAAHASMLV